MVFVLNLPKLFASSGNAPGKKSPQLVEATRATTSRKRKKESFFEGLQEMIFHKTAADKRRALFGKDPLKE